MKIYYNIYRLFAVIVCILLISQISNIKIVAQTGNISHYILVNTANGLEIATIDEKSNTQITVNVIENFAFESASASPGTIWTIPSETFVDAKQSEPELAIVAKDITGSYSLFFYNIVNDTLTEKQIPTRMRPTWSPDGTKLLLQYVPGRENPPQSEALLYELFSDTFFVVTNDPDNTETNFIWLEDNQRIIYLGLGAECQDLCGRGTDIYVYDHNARTSQRLTDIKNQIDPELVPSLCGMVWSDVHQQAYFVVNCTDLIVPPHVEYLYSVDLQGAVRLEESMSIVHPNVEVPAYIKGIYPNLDGSVITVNDLSVLDGYETDTLWSIISIDETQSPNIRYQRQFSYEESRGIFANALSPNNSYIALAGHDQTEENSGLLVIVDVSTGFVVQEIGNIGAVCNIVWNNDTEVIYTQDSDLNCFDISEPAGIFRVNVINGSVEQLDSNLQGESFLIDVSPSSQIECDFRITSNFLGDLINSIETANTAGSHRNICLAGTYTLTTSNNSGSNGANDLPVITSDITLHGLGAGAEITGTLHVSGAGRLTLRNVTVTP